MTQPIAIYASIPASAGADWLNVSASGSLVPVAVMMTCPYWPNLDWSDGNIAPSSGYGEVPQYLWATPVPDGSDNLPKTFTRRLTASTAVSLPNIQKIPVGGATGNRFCLLFSIAADDEYTFQLLLNGKPIEGEIPTTGYNFEVPLPLPWRNVKTYAYGIGNPVTIKNEDVVEIQTTVTNLPQPVGTNNLAMVTWILQLFTCP